MALDPQFSFGEYSMAPLKEASAVQFAVLNPHDIKDGSVVKIDDPTTFVRGAPKPGGLMDSRLGTIDRNVRCGTCCCTSTDCPGHWGHIELAQKMYHWGFLGVVTKILKAVCLNCSKLKCDKDEKFKAAVKIANRVARLRAVSKLCAGKTMCAATEGPDGLAGTGCGAQQPKRLQRERDSFKISVEYQQKGVDAQGIERNQHITAEQAHAILHKISAEDCIALGFNPEQTLPEWLILSVFPVPPPQVRPYVSLDSVNRSDDDLTHKLKDLVKANENLRKQMMSGAPQHILNEYANMVQYHICTLMDNEIQGMPSAQNRSGRALKSIRERLKGKAGRVRQNLMGKRVDFSARTVITADPNLMVDQVGVPQSMAYILTFPDRVSSYNIDKLQQLVRAGPMEYPGAKYIIHEDGKRKDLRYTRAPTLQCGDIVERHIQDDDPVLFNRQPTLHRMSMMGHRVKILPYSTFRMNLSVTTPYNADFDGDEMNLHVPQSQLTRTELLENMMVPRNIVTAQGNKPCMGVVQDSLLGAFRLTQRDTFLDRPHFMNCMMYVPSFDRLPPPAILKPQVLWTGKQLFSLVLPPVNKSTLPVTSDFIENPWKDEHLQKNDEECLVRAYTRGELLVGSLNKNVLGASGGSLVHVISMEQGLYTAAAFLSQVQKVVNNWLHSQGYSIGVGDAIADDHTIRQITDIIEECKRKVQEISSDAQFGNLKPQPGKSVMESFEKEVNDVLNEARNDAGKKAQNSLHRHNAFKGMVNAGSKGSHLNISQVTACVGQQNVDGKRIGFGFTKRTLPHFTQDDHGPESRGFVENSYLRGLTPQEFFFHAMGGREGLIDTACKTSETGYIQRKLVKAMEDLVIRYDGTVRDANGRVVQWLYGEDGMDGSKVELQSVDSVYCDNSAFNKMFRYEETADGSMAPEFGGDYMEQEVKDDILNDPEGNKFEMLRMECDVLKRDQELLRSGEVGCKLKTGDKKWCVPVNVDRLVTNAQLLYEVGRRGDSRSDLHPCFVIEEVQKLIKGLKVVRGAGKDNEARQQQAVQLFSMYLRSKLASKRILQEFKLDIASFNWLVGEIKNKFNTAHVNPGEAVGALAAQSCGEPATQMTLNTFHFAGVSSKNVTLGVPRLRELLSLAKNPKTPSLTLYLLPEFREDDNVAKKVQNAIEYTTLRNITNKVEIHYDPDPSKTVIPEDEEIIQWNLDMDLFSAEEKENMMQRFKQMSPWVVRFEFNSDIFIDKEMRMEDVAERMKEKFDNDLDINVSDDNATKLVLRLRFCNDDERKKNEKMERYMKGEELDDEAPDDEMDTVDVLKGVETDLLENVTLGGVAGIKKVYMSKKKYQDTDKVTGAFKDNNEEWVLETDGSNLLAVLPEEYVDHTKCTSNNVCEIVTVLGIEAVRTSLIREMHMVYDLYGIYINYRHYSLLCDVMTNRGHLMAISRHGINRGNVGPLMRCSYEETVEILYQAAVFGELDNLNGVSGCIMMGKTAKLGTGLFDLLIDTEFLRNHVLETSKDPRMEMDDDGRYGGASPSSFGGDTPSRTPFAENASSPMIGAGGFTPGIMTPYDSAFSPRGVGGMSPGMSPGGAPMSPGASTYMPLSPYSPASPYHTAGSPASPYSPASPGAYSPASPHGPTSPNYGGSANPTPGPSSPSYSPTSPAYGGSANYASATSPAYSPASPAYTPASPAASVGGETIYSPTSPAYAPAAPTMNRSNRSYNGPASPAYSPNSPAYTPTSPALSRQITPYSPASPATGGNQSYTPASPAYTPTSPAYAAESPQYSPASPGANRNPTPGYSVTSPTYSPASPAPGNNRGAGTGTYSPASPNYSPHYSASASESGSGPQYSPASPGQSAAGPSYSPSSPQYGSHSGPAYNASSPVYSASPAYSVASPAYSPASPAYTPASPANGGYTPTSPQYSPE